SAVPSSCAPRGAGSGFDGMVQARGESAATRWPGLPASPFPPLATHADASLPPTPNGLRLSGERHREGTQPRESAAARVRRPAAARASPEPPKQSLKTILKPLAVIAALYGSRP